MRRFSAKHDSCRPGSGDIFKDCYAEKKLCTTDGKRRAKMSRTGKDNGKDGVEMVFDDSDEPRDELSSDQGPDQTRLSDYVSA
jgi:hypothetical protein